MGFPKLRICVAAAAIGFVPPSAEATEWFVAPGGTGRGTISDPFGRVQDGVNAAAAGDIVTILPGTYTETVYTVRDGRVSSPIRVRAQHDRGSVLLTNPGRVLRIDHAHVHVEGLVLDGQYGAADTVDVNTGAHFLVLRNLEVRRSSKDLIDIASPRGVLIDGCLIHRALNAANGRTDAHGIAAGAVHDLTIRNTDIHTFSGDGIQVDPGRLAPGWDRVTVDGVRIWLAPLAAAENGFRAGTTPGENAIDTKASTRLPRAELVIRETTAWGFRDGLISNMAAFNLKENVKVTADRVTVYDSQIAFRLRGPGTAAEGGAWITIQNVVVYNTATAFRYEDNIVNLKIWNSTIGSGVLRPFGAASSGRSGIEVYNLLVPAALPPEAAHWSNRRVELEAFVNAAAHDYMLVPGSAAIDAAMTLTGVTTDRRGTPRPQGNSADVGAYEWTP
jgi:hypothetical protein